MVPNYNNVMKKPSAVVRMRTQKNIAYKHGNRYKESNGGTRYLIYNWSLIKIGRYLLQN
jgi:hypothetical protein